MKQSQKKQNSRCRRHTFELEPLNNQCYFNKTTAQAFCSGQCANSKSQKSQSKNINNYMNYPIFNNDGENNTRAFILSSQKNYKDIAQKHKIQHQKKLVESQQKPTQSMFFIPKPSSKRSFCCVCKENYQDYSEHINSRQHSKNISNSTFNKYIIQLSNKYTEITAKLQRQMSLKSLSFTIQRSTQDLEAEIFDRPRKIQKKTDSIIMNNTEKDLKETDLQQVRLQDCEIQSFQMNSKQQVNDRLWVNK